MPIVTDLSGRLALVTGSATGLGASFAHMLAEAGASLIINYSRSAKEAEQTADECRTLGAQVQVVQADVAEDADCKKLAEAASAHGKLDILVNNAGTTKRVPDHSNLAGLEKEDFLNIYGVNVVGPFMMIKACESLLRATRAQTGRAATVLNTSSIAAVTGIGSSVAYAASKGALNTMTLSLGRALAPDIRVNAVCPGYIGTRWFSDTMDAEKYEELEANIRSVAPLKLASGPDDIAKGAFFFLTDASEHITGETLIVDAGMHLGFAALTAR